MDKTKLASVIQNIRDNANNSYVLAGCLREAAGDDAYAEALSLRWIVPDVDMGTVALSNDYNIIREVRELAEAYEKSKDTECEDCKTKKSDCKCVPCATCGANKCKCPTNESRRFIYVGESATYGLGNTDDRSATPVPAIGDPGATKTATAVPAPVAATPPPTGTATAPVVGSDVSVVENGKTYVGKVQAVGQDGKYKISFSADKPSSADKEFDKAEVSIVEQK